MVPEPSDAEESGSDGNTADENVPGSDGTAAEEATPGGEGNDDAEDASEGASEDPDGSTPDGRCGFVFDLGSLPTDERKACCWRESWDDADDGRCVLHADADKSDAFDTPLPLGEESFLTGAVFRNASLAGERGFAGRKLNGVDFSGADLQYADFSETDLSNADFSNADLTGATLAEANAKEAEFREATLRDADLNDVDARNATFERADMENASLTRANLRSATIEGARVYELAFSDTWINEATELGGKCVYEQEIDGEVEREEGPGTIDGGDRTIESYDAAAWTYRAFQNLCRDNALPEKRRRFYVREKEARRKHAWAIGDRWRAIKAEVSRWTMGHGSDPWRIVGTSAVVIFVFALLYPLSGVEAAPGIDGGGAIDGGGGGGGNDSSGIQDSQTPFTYDFENLRSDPYGFFTVFIKSLYFSAVTFATLGYGDIHPVGPWARSLATVETLLGSVLAALLVTVLARNVTW